MKVKVRLQVGEGFTYDYNLEPNTPVHALLTLLSKDVSEIYNDDEFINTILLYMGKPIYNPSLTLEESGVQDMATLILKDIDSTNGNRRDAGCGLNFLDIGNSKLKRHSWSKSAPRWRIAGPGLCLEGFCKTEECAAFRNMVIVTIGYGVWDFLKIAGRKSNCPICCKRVKPITCGFNNCQWKCKGLKEVENDAVKEVLVPKSGEFEKADDAYHRFEVDDSKNVLWLELEIIVETLK